MKDKNRAANQVLADMMFFDYLKEKVGERKTKTGAYYDLLEKGRFYRSLFEEPRVCVAG